jgi:hypothetical protein
VPILAFTGKYRYSISDAVSQRDIVRWRGIHVFEYSERDKAENINRVESDINDHD